MGPPATVQLLTVDVAIWRIFGMNHSFKRFITEVDVVVECTHLNRSVFTFFLVLYPMAKVAMVRVCNRHVAPLCKKIVSTFPSMPLCI